MSALLKLLIRIERAFIVFFCVALAFLMVVQIILRYVFIAPFLGVEEIAVLLGLWIYFLGLIHVTRTRQHISSGVLQLFVRGRASIRAMEIFKLVVCVASSAIFLVFSVQYWIKTADSGRISTYLSWPMTIWVSSMVAGFGIATLLFTVHLWLVVSGRAPSERAQLN